MKAVHKVFFLHKVDDSITEGFDIEVKIFPFYKLQGYDFWLIVLFDWKHLDDIAI